LQGDSFEFKLENILTDSLYYPASGMDMWAVDTFAGDVYSFVYVDYGMPEWAFCKEIIQQETIRGYSFKNNYRIIHKEAVSEKQLFNILTLPRLKLNYIPKHLAILQSDYFRKCIFNKPYCYWLVMEQLPKTCVWQNPKRLSLLYLCDEGVVAYYALYNANHIAPKIVCIKQPGVGFGGNWTYFEMRRGELAQVVFRNEKLPQYCLYGGNGEMEVYNNPFWPEYSMKVVEQNTSPRYCMWKFTGRVSGIEIGENNTDSNHIAQMPEIPMILVAGGRFNMGAQHFNLYAPNFDKKAELNESPVHPVIVNDYYIGQYPVTQGQWKAVMGYNPSYYTMSDDMPVEMVSWTEVQQFIVKLNQLSGKRYRLPTEAEWEYAARGGRMSRGYRYSGSDTADEVAWSCENKAGDGPHPVGMKKPNELGIYDMCGNVREWCNDWHGEYHSNKLQVNPVGPSSGDFRVARGGSWAFAPNDMRVSSRLIGAYPDGYSGEMGFRLARSR
jgi:formylglycine-generating enzyme required for sulfatase activity